MAEKDMLTVLERAMIHDLVFNDYNSGEDPYASTWTFVVCDTPARKGTFGSLIKKGMAWSIGKLGGDDSTCGLTDKGRDAFASIQAARRAHDQLMETLWNVF